MRNHNDCIQNLQSAGISYEDACALRRISMTLHRWHELECGDGNSYGSWCITRGKKVKSYICTQCGHKAPGAGNCSECGDVAPLRETAFEHDDDGRPYLEHHHYRHGQGKDSTTYTPLADRERGALKRLKAIMARYPDFQAYVQGDPRGCSLYVIRSSDIPDACSINSFYSSRGIAVFK